MGATRHSPDAPGTLDSSIEGIHAPENMEAMVPVPTLRFHRSDHVADVVSTSLHRSSLPEFGEQLGAGIVVQIDGHGFTVRRGMERLPACKPYHAS